MLKLFFYVVISWLFFGAQNIQNQIDVIKFQGRDLFLHRRHSIADTFLKFCIHIL